MRETKFSFSFNFRKRGDGMIWIEDFGKMIKKERLSWGMSRRRLEKLSHVDVETIINIETGKILNPDFYEMLNICDVLDTSVFFYLIDEKEGKK